ncbi:MAG: hypothetical protein V1816_12875 [Pseudomonadota bacterium]
MIFNCPPEIEWAVEQEGLLVIDSRSGRSRFLPQPEAAVWDLFSRGRDCRQVGEIIGAVAGLRPDQVESFILGLVRGWLEAGFLEGPRAND